MISSSNSTGSSFKSPENDARIWCVGVHELVNGLVNKWRYTKNVSICLLDTESGKETKPIFLEFYLLSQRTEIAGEVTVLTSLIHYSVRLVIWQVIVLRRRRLDWRFKLLSDPRFWWLGYLWSLSVSGVTGVVSLCLPRILRGGGVSTSIVDVSLGLQDGKFDIDNQENLFCSVLV